MAALSILVLHAWGDAGPEGAEPDLGPFTRFVPDLAFGVTLFFTLSGFLLYRPFVSSLLRDDRLPSVRAYFRNRALRILPAYWVILLVSALVLHTVVVWDDDGSLVPGSLDAGALLKSALLVQHYDAETVVVGIGPAWSLAVEVVFYALLPVLALLALALARRTSTHRGRLLAVLVPAGLLLVLGLAGKAASAYLVPPLSPFNGWEPDWHSVLERSFLTHADLFAFGMALAVVVTQVQAGRLRVRRGARWAAIVVALAAYLVTAKMTFVDEQLSYSPYNTLMALGCTAFLALVVLPVPGERRSRLVRILEWPPLVAAGLVSYSIFLWHHPLALWLREHDLTFTGAGGFVLNVAILVTVTLALSILTYRFVEYPALRRKRSSRAKVAPATAASYEAAP
jgi:peptidoglycan/LPS O-acetylase OafA/YrhL